MNRMRLAIVLGVVALAAAVVGVGAALTTSGGSSPLGSAGSGSADGSSYGYYRSMMERFAGGSMMGNAYGWMTGATGFAWMMGGASAPNWMRGASLPGFMMGTNTDPGKVMGALFANAPGPLVSPAAAIRLGNAVPPGATVAAGGRRITFAGTTVPLVVLASPPGGPDETFRVAGLVNPTITVNAGSDVSIELVNADPDAAHGLVVSSGWSTGSWMPMLTAAPAFGGSALWFLGDPTPAGMHTGTLTFNASAPGTYHYLCPVPGHARRGMVGTFVVVG